MSVFGVFVVRIFPHSNWKQIDTEYLSVCYPYPRKFGSEKLRIRTIFAQCNIHLENKICGIFTWIDVPVANDEMKSHRQLSRHLWQVLNILAELIVLVNYAKSYYALVVGLLEKAALTNIKLIYVAIFSSCNKEYIFETIERALKLHGRIQVYWHRKYQPNYWQRKWEESFRTCRNREFKIIRFFKLRYSKKYVTEHFEN